MNNVGMRPEGWVVEEGPVGRECGGAVGGRDHQHGRAPNSHTDRVSSRTEQMLFYYRKPFFVFEKK